jgi:hypothetical protein
MSLFDQRESERLPELVEATFADPLGGHSIFVERFNCKVLLV